MQKPLFGVLYAHCKYFKQKYSAKNRVLCTLIQAVLGLFGAFWGFYRGYSRCFFRCFVTPIVTPIVTAMYFRAFWLCFGGVYFVGFGVLCVGFWAVIKRCIMCGNGSYTVH